MVPFVGWRRFTTENHSSKDVTFSCLAGSEPWWMVQKSARMSSHITGKGPHNRKSSAMYNTNYWTDFDTFMYNGFQKSGNFRIFYFYQLFSEFDSGFFIDGGVIIFNSPVYFSSEKNWIKNIYVSSRYLNFSPAKFFFQHNIKMSRFLVILLWGSP